MNPARPLVSVIIPAFNAQATILATVESALAQTYTPLEVLVVDDGSNDQTLATVRARAATAPQLRWLQQANAGVGAARNAGIEAARGEFVALLDADDLWHPDKLARQMAVMTSRHPTPGFVYTLFRKIDDQGRVLEGCQRWDIEGPALRQLLIQNFVGNGSALLMKRDTALAAGGYCTELDSSEDYDLQLRLAAHHDVAVVAEALVGYRQGPGRMSGQLLRMDRAHRRAMARLRREVGGPPGPWFRQGAALNAWQLAAQSREAGALALTLRLLGRALRRDPGGTTRLLGHTLWSRLGRRRSGAAARAAGMRSVGRPFSEVVPTDDLVDLSGPLQRQRLAAAQRADRHGR